MKQVNIWSGEPEQEDPINKLLSDEHLEPPFSVLDRKSGRWQDRARFWKGKGIKSELGRLGDLTFNLEHFDYSDEKIRKQIEAKAAKGECLPEFDEAYGRKNAQGTSIFDPYLCEIMYRWFCPAGGQILDPFAGGSVRGVVAGFLGYHYTGIELRQEQVVSNNKQGEEIVCKEKNGIMPHWICGDSNVQLNLIADRTCDFVFSCPPYMDLEVYSDDLADLSNKTDHEFYILYDSIIKKACQKLKRKGFVAWVVGDVRDEDGYYKDFIGGTKEAFKKAGMKLLNDIVILDPIGTAPVRANTVFRSKKVVKIHQNLLIFQRP